MRGSTPGEDVGYTFTASLSKFNASGCSFSQKLSGLTEADSFCLLDRLFSIPIRMRKKQPPKLAKCGEGNDRKRVKEEIAAVKIGK